MAGYWVKIQQLKSHFGYCHFPQKKCSVSISRGRNQATKLDYSIELKISSMPVAQSIDTESMRSIEKKGERRMKIGLMRIFELHDTMEKKMLALDLKSPDALSICKLMETTLCSRYCVASVCVHIKRRMKTCDHNIGWNGILRANDRFGLHPIRRCWPRNGFE